MACPTAFRLTVRRQCVWTPRQERSTNGSIALRWLSSRTGKDGLTFRLPSLQFGNGIALFETSEEVVGNWAEGDGSNTAILLFFSAVTFERDRPKLWRVQAHEKDFPNGSQRTIRRQTCRRSGPVYRIHFLRLATLAARHPRLHRPRNDAAQNRRPDQGRTAKHRERPR